MVLSQLVWKEAYESPCPNLSSLEKEKEKLKEREIYIPFRPDWAAANELD